MLQGLKNLLGMGPKADFKALVKNGAIVLDVRSKGEYAGGHIKGSINIPLDLISSQLSKIDKSKVVITCCASGMRSASAKSILKSKGFSEVHNGGGWFSLQNKLK